MANIVLPYTFSPGIARSAEVNANFDEIKTKFNAAAVQTDVAKTITAVHTFAANVLFTDNLYDIGASGATRPRDLHLARNLVVGGTTSVTGAVTFSATLAVGTTPATGLGSIRLPNGAGNGISFRNQANNANYDILSFSAGDHVVIAAAGNVTDVNGPTNFADAVTVAGMLRLGGASAVAAGVGDLVVHNADKIRFSDTANTNTVDAVWASGNQIGAGRSDTGLLIAYLTNANLAAGAGGLNGLLAIDSTNNRLVYYSGAARYYLAGTSF